MASRIAACIASLAMAVSTASLALEPCNKNHYLLEGECLLKAVELGIGRARSVATDAHGNVYFSSPNIVFRVDREGYAWRVAGNGVPGFTGDGGPAVNAQLSFPESYPELEADPFGWEELSGPMAVDAAGNLYIADAYNNRVRRVDPSGTIETVLIGWLPQGVAVDRAGLLYVADGTGIVATVNANGEVKALTGGNCGFQATANGLPGTCAPQGIAVDAGGGVLVTEPGYCRVQRLSPGRMTTYAGNSRPQRGWMWTCGNDGDGTPAKSAALNFPFAVAVDKDGTVLIADTYNHCVRRVDAKGIITTIAGHCGINGYAGDGGEASNARLDRPHGVAVDGIGNLYIADTGNKRIRRVDLDGAISTIAGNGEATAW